MMSRGDPYSTPPLPVRALFAIKAAATNPALMWELGKKFWNRVHTADKHARRLDEYSPFIVSAVDAIAAVTLTTHSQIEAVLNEPALTDTRNELLAIARAKNVGEYTWGGFADVCYAICRLNRPTTVVETGVAFGWTTAFILAALEANGHGHLHSIDLPAFRPNADRIVGAVVPDRHRHRWTLRRGSQRTVLPEVLSQVKSVDFFHYDSDKTYQGMKWGYDTVWPAVAPGGVVMSDDVTNDAFLEFADQTRQTPFVVLKPADQQRVGLVKRPAAHP
jgi:predicted O-methyltransferase YrrM